MITDLVFSMVQKENPACVHALSHITQYYDMKLVTLGVDKQQSAVITFPVLVKALIRECLVLYEGTVPVSINDLTELVQNTVQ